MRSYASFLKSTYLGGKLIHSNPEKAIEYFTKAISLSGMIPPKTKIEVADAYYFRAWILNKKLKQTDSAREDYLKAIEINPTHAYFFDELGILYLDEKKHELATECFEKAIQINPSSIISNYGMGILSQRKNNLQEAIFYFSIVLKNDNTHVNSIYKRLFCYFELEESELAFKDYQTVFGSTSKSEVRPVRILTTLMGEERLVNYFELTEINSIAGKSKFERKVIFLSQIKTLAIEFKRAHELVTSEKYNLAIEPLKAILKIESKLGLIHLFLGVCLQAIGDSRNSNKHLAIAETLGFNEAREILNENWRERFYSKLIELTDEQ
ncbi:MAG: tetratricopeptide (TPR) repeat protein [Flammeovirgaceae bacterium]|jgi:tetratricopeptide (TPR) repeat protein